MVSSCLPVRKSVLFRRPGTTMKVMPMTPQPAALDRFAAGERDDFADGYQRHVSRVYAAM
jgi:hypothetical protein